jgi:hypothetical protein
MKLAGQEARKWKKELHVTFVRKSGKKRPIGRFGSRWQDDIQTTLKKYDVVVVT